MAESDKKYFYTYNFIVDNISLLEGKVFTSPSFHTKRLLNLTWHLEFLFSRSSVSFFLVSEFEGSGVELDEMTCSLELLDENHRFIIKRDFSVCPYDCNLKIGTNRFISPSNLFNVLSNSRKDTIILRCHMIKGKFKSSSTVEWTRTQSMEVNSYSYKWIIEDVNSSWMLIKNIRILHLNIDITLEEKPSFIEIKFKLSRWLLHTTLVCRISFMLDEVELFGRRDSKYFEGEDFWRFPIIKKELLGLNTKEKGQLSAVFEWKAL